MWEQNQADFQAKIDQENAQRAAVASQNEQELEATLEAVRGKNRKVLAQYQQAEALVHINQRRHALASTLIVPVSKQKAIHLLPNQRLRRASSTKNIPPAVLAALPRVTLTKSPTSSQVAGGKTFTVKRPAPLMTGQEAFALLRSINPPQSGHRDVQACTLIELYDYGELSETLLKFGRFARR